MPTTAPISKELPPYMGFGNLDPNSVVTEGGTTIASYKIGDELVYQVTLEKNNCLLIEYLDGQEAGSTRHRTLEEAFLHHMMAVPPHKSKRFQRLCERITRHRNIYVRFTVEGERQAAFFPAGCLFVLRQPVVAGNQGAWNALKDKLKREGESAPARLMGEHNGVILRLRESGNVDAEKIIIGDCDAMLLNLADAADMMWQNGVVPPEQEYRLTVMDVAGSPQPGDILIHLSDPARGFFAFSVCITDNMSSTLEQLSNLFADKSIEFLMSRK